MILAPGCVATINSFGAHLASRRYLMGLDWYPLPLRRDHLGSIDYILLDLVDCRAAPPPDPRTPYATMVYAVLDTGQFGVAYWADRIVLLQRGVAPGPELDAVWRYEESLVEEERPCWP